MQMTTQNHRPVMLEQAVSALVTRPEGTYMDCTFGRGGHAREILRQLSAEGRLLALDRDRDATLAAAVLTEDPRFSIHKTEFARLDEVLQELGCPRVQGLLFDLGVSSPQLDEGARGFSFQQDGPLDMRMDQSQPLTAAGYLAGVSTRELAKVLAEYGEERHAGRIASAIDAARRAGPISSTRQLALLVAGAVPGRKPGRHKPKHPATRTFQALRIRINDELGQLKQALSAALAALATGGRLVVISFHSLEDRIVKQFLQDAARGDSYPPRMPVPAERLQPKLRILIRKGRADREEVTSNPRARSAVLRVAEKL